MVAKMKGTKIQKGKKLKKTTLTPPKLTRRALFTRPDGSGGGNILKA
jgi:hypothetical protein